MRLRIQKCLCSVSHVIDGLAVKLEILAGVDVADLSLSPVWRQKPLPPQGSQSFKPAVPKLFGTRDGFCGRQCFTDQEGGGWFQDDSSALKLLCHHRSDRMWSPGSNVSYGEWLQMQMKLCSLTHHSPSALQLRTGPELSSN